MAGLKPASRNKRPPRTDSESTHESIPAFVPTMQPTLVEGPPAGSGWLHEIKYDGYRTQLTIGGGQIRAYTRNGHDWTEKYPSIVRDARRLDCTTALIDGEVCVQNEHGVTDFAALPEAIRTRPHDLIFFAFDLLHLDGQDLRRAPLEERRAKLKFLVGAGVGRIRMSDSFDGDGGAFFSLVDQLGLEGIVSKKKGSRYVSGRADAWLKIKCWHTDTFDVIGVERDDRGISYALLADGHGYRGAAMVTLPEALRDVFWRYVQGRAVSAPPVPMRSRKDASWVGPGMKASVRFLKGSDKLRHATVQGIQIDR